MRLSCRREEHSVKESVDAAIKAFEDGTLADKHYAVKDGDNTWTGKNDYKNIDLRCCANSTT